MVYCDRCKIKRKISEAVFTCDDCEETFCNSCIIPHQQLRTYFTHSTRPIKEDNLEVSPNVAQSEKNSKGADTARVNYNATVKRNGTPQTYNGDGVMKTTNLEKTNLLLGSQINVDQAKNLHMVEDSKVKVHRPEKDNSKLNDDQTIDSCSRIHETCQVTPNKFNSEAENQGNSKRFDKQEERLKVNNVDDSNANCPNEADDSKNEKLSKPPKAPVSPKIKGRLTNNRSKIPIRINRADNLNTKTELSKSCENITAILNKLETIGKGGQKKVKDFQFRKNVLTDRLSATKSVICDTLEIMTNGKSLPARTGQKVKEMIAKFEN